MTSYGALVRTLVASCVLAAAGCGAPDEPDAGGTGLEERTRARLDSLDARTTFFARHLPSGREVAVRPDEPMNTLSAIKVAVLLRAYRDAEEGRLDFDERHELRPEDYRLGSGVLRYFDPGLPPTYGDLLHQMIVTSDNTATDIVIEKVGRRRVNDLMARLGYEETRLLATTGERFRNVLEILDPAHDTLTHREVYEMGMPGGPEGRRIGFEFARDSAYWLGRSTARELARFFEELYRGELASPASTDAMLEIFRHQFSSSRLPRNVRFQGASVAHKTGDWAPHAGIDAGLVEYEGGPIAVAAFTNENRGDFNRLEATLGRIAEDLVETWKRPEESR